MRQACLERHNTYSDLQLVEVRHNNADMLWQVNTSVDNIGARRLHTVLERIVEDISFDAPEKVSMHCNTVCLLS